MNDEKDYLSVDRIDVYVLLGCGAGFGLDICKVREDFIIGEIGGFGLDDLDVMGTVNSNIMYA